jgi:hypothetical protein
VTEKFFFSVVVLRTGTPAFAKATAGQADLISVGSPEGLPRHSLGDGGKLRLNIRLRQGYGGTGPYGLNRARQSSCLNLTGLSSAMIQRHRAVQKLSAVHPRAIHSM